MAIEAKLIDEIGRRTKPDLAASQAVQGLRTDVELRSRDEIRHLLADIIFAAKPRWRAGVEEAAADTGLAHLTMIPNGRINPLFYATTQATEEAIVNAMLQAETMTGANYARVYALPVDRLMAAMKKYGR